MHRNVIVTLLKAGRRDLACVVAKLRANRHDLANVVADHEPLTYFVWLTGDVTFNRKAVSRALRTAGIKYRRIAEAGSPPGFEIKVLRDTQLVILRSAIDLARLDAGRKPGAGWKIER